MGIIGGKVIIQTTVIMIEMIMMIVMIMMTIITSSCTGSNVGIMGGGVKNFSTCSLSAMHATLQPLVRWRYNISDIFIKRSDIEISILICQASTQHCTLLSGGESDLFV